MYPGQHMPWVAKTIASQKVAYRAGFMPAWTSGYRVRFEGELRNS